MDKDSVLYQLMDMRVNGVLDRILEKDSGDMSCPLPVYSIGNFPPLSIPTHSNSKTVLFIIPPIIFNPLFRATLIPFIISLSSLFLLSSLLPDSP